MTASVPPAPIPRRARAPVLVFAGRGDGGEAGFELLSAGVCTRPHRARARRRVRRSPPGRGSAPHVTVRGIAGRPEAMPAARPLLAHESDVRHRGRPDHLDVPVADRSTVQTVKQTLAAPEEDGHDRHVQLVDETGAQVLLDRRHAAP